jgi:hypothetical protein
MKRPMYVLVLLLLIVFGWQGWQYYLQKTIHQPIALQEIVSIELWGRALPGEKRRGATADEVEQIVKWFNYGEEIRQNTQFTGTTPEAGIRIDLVSGHLISIIRSGGVEVQRTDVSEQNVAYWMLQPELQKLLDQLAGE